MIQASSNSASLLKGMFRGVGKFANKLLAQGGLELVYQHLEHMPARQTALALAHFQIDRVIDVGANTGQFARELFRNSFRGDVLSIEPLPQAHAALVASAVGNPHWVIAPQCAAGPDERNIEIHVAGNSVSSSILPMLARHVEAAPKSAATGVLTVQQQKLDVIAKSFMLPESKCLLKIDTQGYERSVLEGAQETLRNAKLVLLELSMQPLYQNQPLWKEMIAYLETRGFELWTVHPEFCDPRTGQTLQLNGIFWRTSASET